MEGVGGGSSGGSCVRVEHAIACWQTEYGKKDGEKDGEKDGAGIGLGGVGSGEKTTWTCPKCTYAHNPIEFLACFCGTQKPGVRRL